MARTELPNGVILPAEYSDDWYEDMTSNLTKLDDVIGSDSEKLNADGVDFLRMSSAALTDGGTGNFSDLNSSYKIKTGDLVLDSGRKLYQVVSVDPTNERFTVGNSLFKITAESDLAPVAESGDYDDLDNKPDLKPVATSGDYDDLTDLPTYGITRYCSSAITDNSSVAFSAISSTNKIKVGDFLLDTVGKMYQISAVDTANETVTVESALIDLALDANVVHTNRNDDVSIPLNSTSAELGVTGGSTNVTFLDKNDKKLSGLTFGNYGSSKLSYVRLSIFDKDADNNEIQDTLEFSYVSNNANAYLRVYRDNFCSLGSVSYRWKGVYATNYYYGSNNVEFSTKFVTTDTAQTVSGAKTFSDNLTIYNSDDTVTPKGLTIRNAQWGMGESGGTTVSNINFLDKNSSIPASVMASKGLYGQSFLRFSVRTKDSQNNTYSEEIYYDIDTSGNVEFRSWHDNIISLGTSAYKWKDVQTKLINGLTPSSLSMPNVNTSSFVDISGYFTNTGTGEYNTYPVTANGWIFLRLGTISSCQASVLDSNSNLLYGTTTSGGVEQILVPVIAGTTFQTQWVTGSTVTVAIARFIPCQGNI